MKRVALSILFLAMAHAVVAQNPKAVFKSLAENDITKSSERFEKINDNTREKMPEMCYLAEAALLNMPQQSGAKKIRGYKILADHINEILSSANAEKTFHNLDITLSEVIANIENESSSYIIKLDTESDYVSYIALAKQANHKRLPELEQHLERCRYNNIVKHATIEQCNFFMSTYPQSSYYDEVATILMDLRFDEAMKSNEESVVEKFIADYPNCANLSKATNHLMELRYKRIFNGGTLQDMKWFVEQYPDHKSMADIKQTMANIEYPTIADSREALEQFIAYYPTTTQAIEAQNRIEVFDIAENGDFSKFIRYYVRNGHDKDFYRLQCKVAQVNGYIILSQNVDDLLLIRFSNKEGKVGYCDFSGNIIIEPTLDYNFEKFFYQPEFDSLSECTKERGLAIVSLSGKQGVINAKGEYVIEPKYMQVAFWDEGIAAIKSVKYHTTEEWEWAEHFYALCDYNGNIILDNQTLESGSDAMAYANWDTSWFTCNVNFEDTYDPYIKKLYINYVYHGKIFGGLRELNDNYMMFSREGESKTCIINRAGEVLAADINIDDTECLYNNVIRSELNSSWKSVIIDLDTRQYLSHGEYNKIMSMSEGLIPVLHHDSTLGFITKDLKPAFEQRFERANGFCNGSAAVCSNNSWYLINSKGEQISTSYEEMAPLHNYEGLYVVKVGDKYGIIDAYDNVVVKIEHELPINNGWETLIFQMSHTGGIVEWKGGKKTQLYNIE